MSDGTRGSTSSGGLRRALAQAGVSIVELCRTRLELASIEFAEERERVKASLILVVVAALFCAIALVAASALVVLCFWDTHRLAAMAAVTAVHLAIGIGALWRLKAKRRAAPAPFSQTLAELERDGEWLAAMVSDRPGSERGSR